MDAIIEPPVPESVRVLDALEGVTAADWDALAGGNATVSHAFLDSLHASGCASPRAGGRPQYPTLWDGQRLVGAAPLYVKSHSYGEYVFDWGWANAYERHGIAYYPKLLCAVPFTPATGPRLLGATPDVRMRLAKALLRFAKTDGLSSLHILFPREDDATALRGEGLLERSGIQFHWRNAGYPDFEAFLAALSHDKRKKIRQERQRVANSGVRLRRVTGHEARAADWDFCIERGIALFEGGAQGEHKHARGFLPEATRSFHWLAHPAFNRAVDEFLGEEGARISAYVDELNERTPFRK